MSFTAVCSINSIFVLRHFSSQPNYVRHICIPSTPECSQSNFFLQVPRLGDQIQISDYYVKRILKIKVFQVKLQFTFQRFLLFEATKNFKKIVLKIKCFVCTIERIRLCFLYINMYCLKIIKAYMSLAYCYNFLVFPKILFVCYFLFSLF